MSIRRFLDGSHHLFDPEAVRVMGVAYELVRAAMGFQDTIPDEVIADKIIELAKTGERNPDLLGEETLNYFRQHLRRRTEPFAARRS
jgi:hypothetical protein